MRLPWRNRPRSRARRKHFWWYLYMVKHIDGNKIGRAARGKAISHSYSRATVNQFAKKFNKNHAEEQQYNTMSYMLEQTTWCVKNQRRMP
jgi:hypothetical protein